MKYLILLRGVNVGGQNKVSMADFKTSLENAGFYDVQTYINSGNAVVSTDNLGATETEAVIEKLLPVKVLALGTDELQKIVAEAPVGFGLEPDKYHYDVIFPIGITSQQIMDVTQVNPGVDDALVGNGVVYYRRLSAERTKSRLRYIIDTPVYKSLTIRNWNTTTKLLELLRV